MLATEPLISGVREWLYLHEPDFSSLEWEGILQNNKKASVGRNVNPTAKMSRPWELVNMWSIDPSPSLYVNFLSPESGPIGTTNILKSTKHQKN